MMQSSACPAISLVGETSVSGSLSAMDCQINAAVETGYSRLFGPGGYFGFALTAMLIIYVLLIGYGLMTGRTRLTVAMMSPRIMTMVLVLTFVSTWPAYHAIFYGLLMGGPDEVAAALLGQRGSAVMNFAQGLDVLFVKFAEIAHALDTGSHSTVATTSAQAPLVLPHSMPITLFWLSGLFLLVSTLGVLILSRLVLYLLLILGPIFIIFALFPQTRGLFNGWLRTSLVFAMAPLFTVLGGTAALMLFVPLISAIGDDPLAAVTAVQPMVILFMGSLIYCAFLFILMWVSASIVKDWQVSLRDAPSDRGASPSQAFLNSQAAQKLALQPLSTYGSSDAQARTGSLVSAISRVGEAGQGTSATRAEVLGLYDPQARAASSDRFSRVQGLGQRFRTSSQVPATTPPIVPSTSVPRQDAKP